MATYNNDYSPPKKLGEILIEMNFATEEQVMNALLISTKQHQKIGTTLVSQGIITLEQLKIVLKEQLGFEPVTEEQLSLINQDVISIFPEEFIRIYRIFPISLVNGNLSVGMVNPNDKTAIDNIIAYSGFHPVIFILTDYEFQILLKKYF